MTSPDSSMDALAEEAGASVAAHIAALLQEAQRIRDAAAADQAAVNQVALEAAREVLARVTAIEDRLGTLVEELRESALRLPDGATALPLNTQGKPTQSIPDLQFDVAQIAENLRAVMRSGKDAPPPPEQ